MPLPPVELDQVTEVTPALSLAVPPRLTELEEAVCAEAEVGLLMLTVGAVVSAGL